MGSGLRIAINFVFFFNAAKKMEASLDLEYVENINKKSSLFLLQ